MKRGNKEEVPKNENALSPVCSSAIEKFNRRLFQWYASASPLPSECIQIIGLVNFHLKTLIKYSTCVHLCGFIAVLWAIRQKQPQRQKQQQQQEQRNNTMPKMMLVFSLVGFIFRMGGGSYPHRLELKSIFVLGFTRTITYLHRNMFCFYAFFVYLVPSSVACRYFPCSGDMLWAFVWALVCECAQFVEEYGWHTTFAIAIASACFALLFCYIPKQMMMLSLIAIHFCVCHVCVVWKSQQNSYINVHDGSWMLWWFC